MGRCLFYCVFLLRIFVLLRLFPEPLQRLALRFFVGHFLLGSGQQLI